MQKFIKIGGNEIMPVAEVYPYIYESGRGKQVLRIIVDPTVSTYEQLKEKLDNCRETIGEYWEEEIRSVDTGTVTGTQKVLKTEHYNYSKDYRCYFNYDNDYPNQFYIELTKETDSESQIKKNAEDLDATNLSLIGLYESISV